MKQEIVNQRKEGLKQLIAGFLDRLDCFTIASIYDRDKRCKDDERYEMQLLIWEIGDYKTSLKTVNELLYKKLNEI